jgi:hypothetical protein
VSARCAEVAPPANSLHPARVPYEAGLLPQLLRGCLGGSGVALVLSTGRAVALRDTKLADPPRRAVDPLAVHMDDTARALLFAQTVRHAPRGPRPYRRDAQARLIDNRPSCNLNMVAETVRKLRFAVQAHGPLPH